MSEKAIYKRKKKKLNEILKTPGWSVELFEEAGRISKEVSNGAVTERIDSSAANSTYCISR